ncbi:MAG: HEAT repeat domain-containing protein [Planctomycetes bacterium]|nr:HEAT repeat domain-containing protein [Planctomycetota bacterium]
MRRTRLRFATRFAAARAPATALLGLVLGAGVPSPAPADQVRLTSGDVLEGEIAADDPEAVVVRTTYGTMRIERNRVAAVLRSPRRPSPSSSRPAPTQHETQPRPTETKPLDDRASTLAARAVAEEDEGLPQELRERVAKLAARLAGPLTAGARAQLRDDLESLPAVACSLVARLSREAREPATVAVLREAADTLRFRLDAARARPELGGDDPRARANGLRALAAEADPHVVPYLLRTLAVDPAREAKQECLRSLARIGDVRAAPALVRALRADEVRLVGEASAAITSWASNAARPELLEALLRAWEGAPSPRSAVLLEALVTIERPVVAEAFLRCVSAPEAEVRAAAFGGLARVGTASAADACARGLGDPAPSVRAAAATALGRAGRPEEAAPRLIEALRDPDPAVIRAAHMALQASTGERFAPEADVWTRWWRTRPGK